MAVEVFVFSFNVPKGGTAVKPLIFPMLMPAAILEGVEIYVPSGGNGQLFFGLGSGGTITLPTGAGQFITANGETIKWPLTNQIESGNWQLLAYNTGTSPHFIQVRFLVTPPGLVALQSTGGFLQDITFEIGGGTGQGGGGGGGGQPYSFAIETPLPILDVTQGGSGTAQMVLDEVGTRPGGYTIQLTGIPNGLNLTANPTATPTAFLFVGVAQATLTAGSYAITVQVANGGVTNTATLTVAVAAASSGGSGGGGQPPPAPTLNLSTMAAAQGGTVTYNGTNWIPGTGVTVVLAGGQSTSTVDSQGSIGGAIVIPASTAPGTYTATAGGSNQSAAVPGFTVTAAQPPPTAPTGFQPTGQTVTVAVGSQYWIYFTTSANYYVSYAVNGNYGGNIGVQSSGYAQVPNTGYITAQAGTWVYDIQIVHDSSYTEHRHITVLAS